MSSLYAPNSNRSGSITLLFFDNGTWFPTGEAFGKKKKTGAASVTYDTRLFFYLFC
jgi:hypothetical protein